MERQAMDVIEQCATQSQQGLLSFADIVLRLLEVGVSYYHTDYIRGETTYYFRNGETHEISTNHPDGIDPDSFDAATVAAAVTAAQGGLPYNEFVDRTARAGCAGYLAFLEGKRVMYYGLQGDLHTEYFPGTQLRPMP